MKIIYKNCMYQGRSKVPFNSAYGPLREYSFNCLSPQNYDGVKALSFSMSDEKMEKLLDYKVNAPLKIGQCYDLVYKDYENNKQLRLSIIYPVSDVVDTSALD